MRTIPSNTKPYKGWALFLFLTYIKIHFSIRFKNTKVHPKVRSKVTTKKV